MDCGNFQENSDLDLFWAGDGRFCGVFRHFVYFDATEPDLQLFLLHLRTAFFEAHLWKPIKHWHLATLVPEKLQGFHGTHLYHCYTLTVRLMDEMQQTVELKHFIRTSGSVKVFIEKLIVGITRKRKQRITFFDILRRIDCCFSHVGTGNSPQTPTWRRGSNFQKTNDKMGKSPGFGRDSVARHPGKPWESFSLWHPSVRSTFSFCMCSYFHPRSTLLVEKECKGFMRGRVKASPCLLIFCRFAVPLWTEVRTQFSCWWWKCRILGRVKNKSTWQGHAGTWRPSEIGVLAKKTRWTEVFYYLIAKSEHPHPCDDAVSGHLF